MRWVAPTTCCRGASTDTSVEAQEAAEHALDTIIQLLLVAPLRSATRTTSCPGYPTCARYIKMLYLLPGSARSSGMTGSETTHGNGFFVKLNDSRFSPATFPISTFIV